MRSQGSWRDRRLSGATINPRRWERVRRQAFARDHHRCRRCGRSGRLEAHHEPPLERGGNPFDLAGVVTLCRGCHIERHRADRRREPTPAERAWGELVAELAGS